MAESIIEQSRRARGAKGFLKNKLFVLAVLLLGGGALLVCLPQLKFIGALVHIADEKKDEQSLVVSRVPDREPDIVGMVEAVGGNEITVLEFDPDAVDVPMTGTQNSEKSTSESENAISLGQTSSMSSGGGMPGGGGPPGSGSSSSKSSSSRSSSSGSSSSNRETIMAELKSASTGKQKIVVPIGISILKAASTDSGTQKENTSFTDLTSDTMVKVWLKKTEDGKSVAEFVDITGKVNMSNSNN